ncbi:hypothetical protein [Larkinella soli]|uniref:hypothetical protein n=1 Tax=Larkinella soli TaxID=1770527 RepID=UPI000FFBE9E5|nr:hypothetical protein [Larkinella soli]
MEKQEEQEKEMLEKDYAGLMEKLKNVRLFDSDDEFDIYNPSRFFSFQQRLLDDRDFFARIQGDIPQLGEFRPLRMHSREIDMFTVHRPFSDDWRFVNFQFPSYVHTEPWGHVTTGSVSFDSPSLSSIETPPGVRLTYYFTPSSGVVYYHVTFEVAVYEPDFRVLDTTARFRIMALDGPSLDSDTIVSRTQVISNLGSTTAQISLGIPAGSASRQVLTIWLYLESWQTSSLTWSFHNVKVSETRLIFTPR